MKKLKICIAGLGNVGSSVVNLIEKNSSYVETKSHLKLEIIGLSAKNINKERSFDIKKYKWSGILGSRNGIGFNILYRSFSFISKKTSKHG